ncbi:hypothetical protein RCH14_004126 [Massilia sp. MP_M2]|uniref:hypothetical protein n=1 Tax=Massilia sp. MP_M2 TaxID=3071713 RepID=UPI00319E2D62
MARRYSTARVFYSIVMLCLGAVHSAHAIPQGAASPDLLEARARLQEAEARQAIAEAERAELLARLPPAQARTLGGSVDIRGFGAAGLARAVDLTLVLAAEICQILPPGRVVILYDASVSQGIVVARTVDAALLREAQELAARNAELQRYIETSSTPGARRRSAVLLAWLTAPAMVLRAGADLANLFKTDTTLAGTAYGDGARALFASAMARNCPARLAGLSGGYMGELDVTRHAALLERVRLVGLERAALARHVDVLDALAATAKGESKKELAAVAAAATGQLKAADSFIDSLRAGEASDKSPLFTTARYLGQAERSAGALVLDVDLRLEGLAVQRDHLFTGERLALSGVAFLWYRLHEPDGRLIRADALRRISRPVQVNLRGVPGGAGFWDEPGVRMPQP